MEKNDAENQKTHLHAVTRIENLKYAVLNLPRESDAVEDYGNSLSLFCAILFTRGSACARHWPNTRPPSMTRYTAGQWDARRWLKSAWRREYQRLPYARPWPPMERFT